MSVPDLGPLTRLKSHVGTLVKISRTLGSYAEDLKLFAENPRRAIKGVIFGSVVGLLVTVTEEVIAVGKYIAGLPVGSHRYICGRPRRCDPFGLVDIPGLILGVQTEGIRRQSALLLNGLGSMIESIAVPAGPAAPIVVFAIWAVLTLLFVYGAWYGTQALMTISPYP